MAIDVDAILGFGTVLKVDRGSGYETIAGMVTIGEFGADADEVERTTHGSPGGWRRFGRGLIDPGSMPLSGYWVAHATQVDMMDETLSDFVYEAELPYRVVLPNGMGQFDCNGFLKNFKIDPQMDGNIEFNAELRWSGQASFTVTTSAGLTTPFFDIPEATTITPAPAQATTEYVAVVPTGTTTVTVEVTAAVGVIRVNGAIVLTGGTSTAIALGAAGSITRITITVTETGEIAREYIIDVVRLAA